MTEPILECRDVTVRFGGLVALRNASISVRPNAITALIGPNGAGKSTFLDVLSGFRRPTTGDVLMRGKSILGTRPHKLVTLGMARTFQNVEVFTRLTAAENVALAVPKVPGDDLLSLALRPRAASRARRAALQTAVELLETVGIAQYADDLAGELSYGVQKLLVLARLMATQGELLMLDEPGAGLPVGSIRELGDHLTRLVREESRTVLFVDHNMDLVLNFADYVYVLHHGEVIASGVPDEIRANERVVDVYLSGDDDAAEADEVEDAVVS